jgi:acrylyl-CoA reductase (NADPH)
MASYKGLLVRKEGDEFVTTLETLDTADLPEGDVVISVEYSSLNYKDALSSVGNPGVSRNFPHTPGIDAAGTVVSCSTGDFAEGDAVIVTGFDLGMHTKGGLAERICVPAGWVTPLPEGLSAEQAMTLGTAGLTAGLCVAKLLQNGATPAQGPVVVSGASGGVGSVAVALLAKLGFDVHAVCGKPEFADALKSLGATEVVGRDALEDTKKPMLKPQWAHGVDTVGGGPLQTMVKSLRPGGSVACCGLAASHKLELTVFPFILRGANLLGVDSVEIPLKDKAVIWEKFAGGWSVDLSPVAREVSLEEVVDVLPKFLQQSITGRYLVRVQG